MGDRGGLVCSGREFVQKGFWEVDKNAMPHFNADILGV